MPQVRTPRVGVVKGGASEEADLLLDAHALNTPSGRCAIRINPLTLIPNRMNTTEVTIPGSDWGTEGPKQVVLLLVCVCS